MDSSRMRTTSSLPYSVVLLTDMPLDKDPSLDKDPLLDRDPWTETPSWTETAWLDTPWIDTPWTETSLFLDPSFSEFPILFLDNPRTETPLDRDHF